MLENKIVAKCSEVEQRKECVSVMTDEGYYNIGFGESPNGPGKEAICESGGVGHD